MSIENLIIEFGYFGIAAIIFAESGLFFGFFLPGDSLLFIAGFMASQGLIHLPLLILLTVPAAILGNSVGYWFGSFVGPKLFSREDSFWFSKKRIADAHAFFEKHGSMSIVLARFIPAVRTFVPIIAGVGSMNYPTFLTYNILGSILWGALIPLAGFYLGSTVAGIDRYILPIVLIIALVSVAPIALEYWKHKTHRGSLPKE